LLHQDDFVIPGISPLLAISLKQILHKPKSLIKPLPRPHLKQRFTFLEENFGTRFDFSISDFFAICSLSLKLKIKSEKLKVSNLL